VAHRVWSLTDGIPHQKPVLPQDLTLKDRVFECECGHTQDRDLNAASNSAHYAVRYTVPLERKALAFK